MGKKTTLGLVATPVALLAFLVFLVAIVAVTQNDAEALDNDEFSILNGSRSVSELAEQEIGSQRTDGGPNLISMYQESARVCENLPWTFLAAIGEQASNHGTIGGVSLNPETLLVSTSIQSLDGTGGLGPMQIKPEHWETYKIDGDQDGFANINDLHDASATAAAILCNEGPGITTGSNTELRAAASFYFPGDGSVVSQGSFELVSDVVIGQTKCDPMGKISMTAERVGNAQIIIEVGNSKGVPAKGIITALATAYVESTLINVNYGDEAGPDSRGLFQQRSVGWGTLEERMNPVSSSTSFYNALLRLDNWESMDPGVAAQKVQISACDHRYGQVMNIAEEIYGALSGYGIYTSQIISKAESYGQVTGSGQTSPDGKYALPVPKGFGSQYTKPHHNYPSSDIVFAVGTELYAAASGTATVTFNNEKCGHGVSIESGSNKFIYCHLSKHFISTGPVQAGELIGLSGGLKGAPGAGSSTGPHLHFDIKYNGVRKCPNPWLRALEAGDNPPEPSSLISTGCFYANKSLA